MKKQEAIKYLNGVLETNDSGLLLESYKDDDIIPEYVIDFMTAHIPQQNNLNLTNNSKCEVGNDVYVPKPNLKNGSENQGNLGVIIENCIPEIVTENQLQNHASSNPNIKEETIDQQQVKVQKESTGIEVSQFPTTVTGEIDYTQIQEPMEYAKALMQEFGEEAISIVEDLITEQQELLNKAEKLESAIERKRKVKAFTVEIDKLNEVRTKLTGNATTQIKKNTNTKSNQSESSGNKNIKSSPDVKNIFTVLKKHKFLTSIGLVLLILMLSNPSNSRYTDYLRANGKPLSLKEAHGYYERSTPQWGKDQNYLFFSIFKYHSPSHDEITHIGVFNNFYLL